MKPVHKNELYENITHMTAAAPYSLYHVEIPLGVDPALYLHWHNEMEFFLLLEGELCFHIESQSYILHSGEGIFIPPKLLHHAVNTGSVQVVFRAFVFSSDIIFSSFDTRTYQTYILPVMHNNLSCAVVLRNSVDWQKDILINLQHIFSAEKTNELYIRGLSFLIWDRLYHHHISRLESIKALPALAQQLSGVIAYLHDNYNKSLTLGELAAQVPLSEAQFCRSFKQLTGMPPFQYLIRYRILQSCNELISTNKKVTDIAISNGFNNISYYNRAFLQLMNMTPSEYRKKHIASSSVQSSKKNIQESSA